jgi:hypothetical protein
MMAAFRLYNFDATGAGLHRRLVQPIHDQRQQLPFGFVTPDDSWSNRWRAGPNASFGWGAGPGSGVGAKSLGQELASSDMFAQCQVTKVFQAVCFRAPISTADQATVAAIKSSFKSGYNLKQVFQQSAAACAGS